jgi:hypothetical protein
MIQKQNAKSLIKESKAYETVKLRRLKSKEKITLICFYTKQQITHYVYILKFLNLYGSILIEETKRILHHDDATLHA